MVTLRNLLFLLFLIIIAGCSNKTSDSASATMKIFVSIPPQKYFLEKLCVDRAEISVLLPPGASPHSYEPKPSQMARLSKSRIYFSVGGDFEASLLPRLRKSCPNLLIIPTDSTITRITFDEEHEADHAVETAEEHHSHHGTDPHIWLSPELVKEQVKIMADALCEIDTLNRQFYRQNYSLFIEQISSLQAAIKERLKDCKSGEPFMVFHPSWGYFAREFNLTQIAIEIDGKEPSMRELGIIFKKARADSIHTIFTQPQFSSRSAELIAKQLNVQVVSANPLAENWDESLLKLSEAIGKK